MANDKPFTLRCYSKKELALMYFPNSTTPHAAVNHLMAWINRCVQLKGALIAMGYRKNDKFFTPRQVAEIVAQLGEP